MNKSRKINSAKWLAASALLSIAVLAVLATMTSTSIASAQSDAVTGLTVATGSNPGELDVTWDAHHPQKRTTAAADART